MCHFIFLQVSWTWGLFFSVTIIFIQAVPSLIYICLNFTICGAVFHSWLEKQRTIWFLILFVFDLCEQFPNNIIFHILLSSFSFTSLLSSLCAISCFIGNIFIIPSFPSVMGLVTPLCSLFMRCLGLFPLQLVRGSESWLSVSF